jgi:hypothetical protein
LTYDISIHSRFDLIYVSEGLCISPNEQCELESVGTDSRQRRNHEEEDKAVCDLYLNRAINVTRTLNMLYEPDMIANLRVSCLHDLMTTNDTTVSINIAIFNSLNLNYLGWRI